MTSRNTCTGKQSLPPQIAVPLNEPKDEGMPLVKMKWLAQKQEWNQSDCAGPCWQTFLPGRGERIGMSLVSLLCSIPIPAGKGGGHGVTGCVCVCVSFGQSSSKKSEQLETAGCNFSDPQESMILC